MYRSVNEIYQILDQVGAGGYGKVYKAKSRDPNAIYPYVALKMIRVEVEREGFPLTAIREVSLLRSLHDSNMFVKFLDIATSDTSVFLVFEYLPWDLSALMLHPKTTLNISHIKCILKQILQAMDYLHSVANVIHRDVKGSNFLLDARGAVKLCDFGLARRVSDRDFVADELRHLLTNRVITIWYRPPELLLGSCDYGYEVDIWGVGCVMGELFAKRPPFCGSCEISQLESIFEALGPPPDEIMHYPLASMLQFPSVSPKLLECIHENSQIDVAKNIRSDSISSATPQSLSKELNLSKNKSSNCSSPVNFNEKIRQQLAAKTLAPFKTAMTREGWDLFLRLITLDPKKRITAKEALQHAFFTSELPVECAREELTKIVPGEWHEWEIKNLQKGKSSRR